MDICRRRVLHRRLPNASAKDRDGVATIYFMGICNVFVGLESGEDLDVSVILFLVSHSFARFPAGDHSFAIVSHFARPPWFGASGSGNGGGGDQGATGEGKLETTGYCDWLQWDPLIDGALNDFRCMGLHSENCTVETGAAISCGVPFSNPW